MAVLRRLVDCPYLIANTVLLVLHCPYFIVRCVSSMKRIFSTPIPPLLLGLALRLLFILKFPANSGDTILYEQMATNWLQHHVYAMNVDGAITPVDLRMPGYPAFLALIYLFSGKVGAAAHTIVMFVQVLVDLLDCLAIAALAVALSAIASRQSNSK